MNIKTRLTLMFTAVVLILLAGVSIAIYFFSADYRQESFYQRLKNKAVNTAQLLIEVEEVNAELLTRMEKDNPSALANERITIFNYKNEVLYSSDVGRIIQVDSLTLNKIRLQKEYRFTQGQYEILGFLFVEKFDRIAVVAAATDIYGFSKLKNLRNILSLIFLISTIIVPISGWLYAERALNPISNLVNQADTISATQLNRRLSTTNKGDEIGKLVLTFNNMLDRLEKAFQAQKHFIANASHELRTPLTSITGEIEVTLIQPRSPEKYQHILKSVLDESKNLNRLSNQLLMLAQTSADSPGQNMELQRVDELLWQCKDEMLRDYPEAKIEIELDSELDDELLSIRGDGQLLSTAFTNLIDNACKYSDDKVVHVRLIARSNGIEIVFENKGIGIDPADITSIFEPFYRGKNTRSKKGHGIGLSLVNSIVTLHDGVIRVQSEPGVMTRFTVSFPTARAW